MAGTNRDVRIRLESLWEGSGITLAQREVSRFENDYRRMAQMQMRAANEMAAAEAAKAAKIAAANRAQMNSMNDVGRVILGLSGATAAGLVLATKAAIDWESAWAGVKKTVDGSPEQMAALEQQLRQLATTLPATHEEIAAVAEAAGQLGVARGDIAAFTETAINLGETTNLSADQAATSLAQLMNIMKTAPDQVDELGSTLVALGNAGASTEQDIVSMALRLAGAGELIGATEGEVLATASALSSMGVSAEAGGGATSRVLQKLYSAMAEGGDKVEAFAQVAGMSADEFATAWREDPIRALASFADGLNGVESSGGNVIQTLRDLGIRSSEEQRIILQLKANADLLTDSLDLQSEAWDANNALQDEAAQRYATTEAKLQVAQNKINDVAIDIGGNFLPIVADGVEWVGKLADGFASLTPGQQSFVTTLGAAATGIGLVTGAASIVIPKLKQLSETITALRGGTSLLGRGIGGLATALTGPFGVALAAAAVGVGIFMAQQGEAKQRTDALRQSLDEATGAATGLTRELIAQSLVEEPGWVSSSGINQISAAEGADRLGISLNQLTDAAMGNVDAWNEVTAVVGTQDQQLDGIAERAAEAGLSIGDYNKAVAAVRRELFANAEAMDLSQEQWLQYSEAVGGEGTAAMDDAAAAAAGATEGITWLGDAGEDAAAQAEDLNQQIQALVQAMEDLNSPTLDARAAARAWEASLDAVTESIEENGRTLNINTEAGRANQGVLDQLARDAMALAAAVLEGTGSEEEFRASLEKSREALFEQARRYGMTEQAAWDYVNSVLAMPEVVPQEVVLETANATNTLLAWRNKSTGKRITVYVDAVAGNTYRYDSSNSVAPLAKADGGIVEFYSAGGVRRLTPMAPIADVVPADTWRVIGDRPVDDEFYIPDDRSARSYAVLGEAMRRFGLPAAVVAGSSQAAAGGNSYRWDVSVTADPGVATEVAELTAERVRTRLGDAMNAAGISADGL